MLKKKSFYTLMALAMSLLVVLPLRTRAMHIAEGYLPAGWCLFWGALSLPFFILGLIKVKKKIAQDKENKMLLGVSGAFSFVLSALKLPSFTGSTSHPTGIGLGAILFGPFIMTVLGTIVLVFQALFLAHGGLTTLGANVFSMAVVGSLVAYGVYKFSRKFLSLNVSVFLAAALGDLLTYITTSVQLSLAYPDQVSGFMGSMAKFMGIFAITQIPLAICEGLLTVLVINAIMHSSDKNLITQERGL